MRIISKEIRGLMEANDGILVIVTKGKYQIWVSNSVTKRTESLNYFVHTFSSRLIKDSQGKIASVSLHVFADETVFLELSCEKTATFEIISKIAHQCLLLVLVGVNEND